MFPFAFVGRRWFCRVLENGAHPGGMRDAQRFATPPGGEPLTPAQVVDRTEAMLRMMTLGLSLHEIEEQLDWLDAKARLERF